jgi:hypothetical protein
MLVKCLLYLSLFLGTAIGLALFLHKRLTPRNRS